MYFVIIAWFLCKAGYDDDNDEEEEDEDEEQWMYDEGSEDFGIMFWD